MAAGSNAATRAPSARIRAATSSAGESLMSSEPGLNARPSTPTRRPSRRAPPGGGGAAVPRGGGGPRLYRVDLGRDRRRPPPAEWGGPGPQAPVVLGQAPAAKPKPGAQRRTADPRVPAERVGEAEHVRA